MGDSCGSRHPERPELVCEAPDGQHADHLCGQEWWPNTDFEPKVAAPFHQTGRATKAELNAIVRKAKAEPAYRPETIEDFDGATFDLELDGAKLTNQLAQVGKVMADGRWHTVPEIVSLMEGQHSETGVSARIRDLRKDKFGGHTIVSRRRGGAGTEWEYQWRPKEGAEG